MSHKGNEGFKLKPESKWLEYKEAKRSLPKSFWTSYSSFANTQGGLIVLGVKEESDNCFMIEGVEEPEKIKKELFSIVYNSEKVNVPLLSDDNVKVREVNNKTVIEIHIEEAPSNKKPVYLNNNIKHTYKRTNEGDRRASEDELKYMIRNSSDELDSEVLTYFSIEDLNSESIDAYKKIIINSSSTNEKYKQMDIEDFLIEIGAMKKNREGDNEYYITVGGLLFFGKYNSITDKLPHFHLDYFNRSSSNDRWLDRVATGDPKYPDLNIFSFFQIVLEKLKLTVFDEFELDGNSARRTTSDDVEVALREALANSLIHADYFSEETIKIEAYRGYYEFFNPGNMKISIEEFARGGDSKPRNNTIATLFRRVGFCERAGSGGPKIFEAAQKNKLRFPEVTVTEESTKLKLWKVDIIDAHPDLSNDERRVLKYITKNMLPVTRKELQDNLELTRYYVGMSIDRLIDKGLIEQEGNGRSTKYSINSSTTQYLANLQSMMKKLESYLVNK